MPPDKGIIRHAWAAAGTIVAALLVQTAGALFWAGSITARMNAVERDVVRVDSRFHEYETGRMATANKKEKP